MGGNRAVKLITRLQAMESEISLMQQRLKDTLLIYSVTVEHSCKHNVQKLISAVLSSRALSPDLWLVYGGWKWT